MHKNPRPASTPSLRRSGVNANNLLCAWSDDPDVMAARAAVDNEITAVNAIRAVELAERLTKLRAR